MPQCGGARGGPAGTAILLTCRGSRRPPASAAPCPFAGGSGPCGSAGGHAVSAPGCHSPVERPQVTGQATLCQQLTSAPRPRARDAGAWGPPGRAPQQGGGRRLRAAPGPQEEAGPFRGAAGSGSLGRVVADCSSPILLHVGISPCRPRTRPTHVITPAAVRPGGAGVGRGANRLQSAGGRLPTRGAPPTLPLGPGHPSRLQGTLRQTPPPQASGRWPPRQALIRGQQRG